MTILRFVLLGCFVSVASVQIAWPQGGPGPGKRNQENDEQFRADRDLFHFLLEHRQKIRRDVKKLENGVETLTESDEPQVATKIQEHVASMYRRLKEGRPIHRRDPLFDELFRHAKDVHMKVEKTDKGIKATETSKDPHVVRLIQEHANVVSLFLKNGFVEVRKNHAVPKSSAGDGKAEK